MRVDVIRRCGLILVTGLVAIAGCSTAQYHGASPSARAFTENPGVRDYYVGMNFNFSVDRPTEYHRGAMSDAGAALAVPVATAD